MQPSPTNTGDRQFAETPLKQRDFWLLAVQLAVLLMLVRQFHLEEKRHLFEALALAAAGFAVHAWLPARFRRLWFTLVSIGAVALVIGFLQAAWVAGIAAVLIAVVRLPINLRARVAALSALGAGFAWWRERSDDMFWPIVGSMFMFRLIVYVQSTRRERVPSTLAETGSYFFLFPNAFFPFFPVVDYDTFRETYYNDERRAIYQRGIHWMAVGVSHLMIYRLIKYELLPTPLEIRSGADAALFLAMNYALYVRVSGLFHLICGMLHLFGFNLPRTHDAYFLATSFSDIWRRINIYWKDFMAKSFFFPAYFRIRLITGDRLALSLAVLWVFLWTWIGHSWQVFWLLGDFPLRMSDALLWLGVGMLVAANTILSYGKALQPSRAETGFSVTRAAVKSLKVVGVFACVSVFWTQWSNPEVLQMLAYSAFLAPARADAAITLGQVAVAAVAVGVAFQYATRRRADSNSVRVGRVEPGFDRSVGLHLGSMVGILLLFQPPVYDMMGTRAARLLGGLQVDRASRSEALVQIAGYYEDLNDNSLQAGPFLGDPAPKQIVQAVDFGDMLQFRHDLMAHELIPNWKGTCAGATVTVNRWGMRDRDRAIVKPPGTLRIALVGSSLVMGFGVGDEQTFAALLEDRLNHVDRPDHRPVEVLNFAYGNCYPVQRRLVIEHKVLPFDPDLIVYFAHQDELYTSARLIAGAVYHGMDLEDDGLKELVRTADIPPGASEAMLQAAMEQHHVEILRCVYRRMLNDCREARARLLYVYFPVPGDHDLPFDPRICLRIAAEQGIETIDLHEWWGERRADEVLTGPGDHHPNALGHRLLAGALEEVLEDRLTFRAKE
jgi:hypothetical protein